MNSGTAWIISDELNFTSQLEKDLTEQVGCRVACTTMSSWPDGQQPQGYPQWLLVDLRSPEAWSKLPAVRDHVQTWRGQPVPLIGIIDGGLPPEQSTLADHWLAATPSWPLTTADLPGMLSDALEVERIKQREQVGGSRALSGSTCRFLTYTPALFPVLENLEVAARHDFTVLLVGETGTGKTTLARLMHEMSTRRDNRFLTVGCGTLPGELIDSELFGHVKGAFTGADKAKEGKFDAAQGGTILLDEIDVLGNLQQAKLLRVLETGEFEPVGSNDTRVVDARTIVASNVSLETLVEKQCFRVDLYYRLNQVKFEIPPLRDRPRDIVPLALDFVEECCRENGLAVDRIHPEFLQVIKAYSWPGNIRQLRNEIRRAVLFCRDGLLSPNQLSPAVISETNESRNDRSPAASKLGLAGEVAQTEQSAIEQMLRAHNFNRAATARALGISRVTLYNKIRKYHISVDASEQAARG